MYRNLVTFFVMRDLECHTQIEQFVHINPQECNQDLTFTVHMPFKQMSTLSINTHYAFVVY